jgi:7-carboxy-7-deazaguanine synthase
MKYALNDLYRCIQGEGAMTGTPMMLIRLQGCGVGCPWCDTKETWSLDPSLETKLPRVIEDVPFEMSPILGTNARWASFGASDIAKAARLFRGDAGIEWALITGGEPADQDLAPLVDALHESGFQVAVETSGTAAGYQGADIDWLTVSPKFDMPGGKQILGQAIMDADEIKMVVGVQGDIDTLLRMIDLYPLGCDAVVSVQPVSESVKARNLCVQASFRHGWRVSVQTHKIMGNR